MQRKTGNMSTDEFQKFVDLFFGEARLSKTIVILCKYNVFQGIDPISEVASIILSVPLELHLGNNGLHMFRGKDLLFPYQQMDNEQREFFLELLAAPDKNWHRYELSMIWRHNGSSKNLVDPLQVLLSICKLVQNSSKIKDAASKLVISNVILQRIQSHVPISKAVQLQLNMLLFETDTGVSKDGMTSTEDGMTTGVSKDGITSTEDLNETCVQKQDGLSAME
jgi:hypothetical protein